MDILTIIVTISAAVAYLVRMFLPLNWYFRLNMFTWNRILRTLNVTLSLCRRIRYILFIFLYFRLKLGKNIKITTALYIVAFWEIFDDKWSNIWIYNNLQVVRPDDKQSPSARYIIINTLKSSLYLVWFLLFRTKHC